LLFLGNDWAEEHHDVELQDHTGARLAKARLDDGVDGVTKLHELVARHRDSVDSEVLVGIETDRVRGCRR
jgi:hypothetical protein